jgi:hypothetical protein
MLTWIKKHFIPHKRNNFKPHILRKKAVMFFLVFIFSIECFFLAAIFFIKNNVNFLASILPDVIISETNSKRQMYDLTALAPDVTLEKAAQLKADDMAAKGYFAHTSPEGITPWHWLDQAGYKYTYAGENLAINFVDSDDVINAWMNSVGHKANILNNNFTQIGIGIASGQYQGKETIFVVQLFAQPIVVAAPTEEKPVVKATQQTPTKQIVKTTTAPAQTAPPIGEVKGAENSQPVQEMFTTSQNAEGDSEQTQPIKPAVTINNNPAPAEFNLASVINKIIASPRATANCIFALLFAVITCALLLKTLIKIQIQHPALILGGFLILIALGALFLFNQHLALASLQIF